MHNLWCKDVFEFLTERLTAYLPCFSCHMVSPKIVSTLSSSALGTRSSLLRHIDHRQDANLHSPGKAIPRVYDFTEIIGKV